MTDPNLTAPEVVARMLALLEPPEDRRLTTLEWLHIYDAQLPRFIAWAREAVPALAARVVELEAALNQTEAMLVGVAQESQDRLARAEAAEAQLAARDAEIAKLKAALLFIAARMPSEAPTGPKDGNGHCAWTAYHTARAALQGETT